MRLLVTADDFGYSKDTYDETIKFFDNGYLNNISIMTSMPFSDDALRFASCNKSFSFGVHLTFSRDSIEAPMLTTNVNTLIDSSGRFHLGKIAQVKSLFSLFSLEQIKNEMRAQLDYASKYIVISYVDSHMHLHKYPIFQRALNDVLPEYGIEKVRSPQNLYCQSEILTITKIMSRKWRKNLCSSFTSSDFFFMETKRSKFTNLVLPEFGDIEVGIHPGTAETWRIQENSSFLKFYKQLSGNHFTDWKSL